MLLVSTRFLQNSYTYKPLILDLLWYRFLVIGEKSRTDVKKHHRHRKSNMRRQQQGKSPQHHHFFFRFGKQVKGDVDLAEPSQLRALSVRTSELPELLPLGHGLGAFDRNGDSVASFFFFNRKPPCNSTQKRWLFGREIHPLFSGKFRLVNHHNLAQNYGNTSCQLGMFGRWLYFSIIDTMFTYLQV